jgi:hypothetical protein
MKKEDFDFLIAPRRGRVNRPPLCAGVVITPSREASHPPSQPQGRKPRVIVKVDSMVMETLGAKSGSIINIGFRNGYDLLCLTANHASGNKVRLNKRGEGYFKVAHPKLSGQEFEFRYDIVWAEPDGTAYFTRRQSAADTRVKNPKSVEELMR